MDKKQMQMVIDYIEDYLKTDIQAEELACMAGYSVFHFYRLFMMATGMPVMQYVQRRRMLHAVWEIRSGKRRIDVILEYGFDTYAGFYRAFRSAFSCTPSQYLKMNRAKRPYRLDLSKEEVMHLSHKMAKELLKHWQMEKEPVQDIFYENTGNRNENAYYVGDNYVLKFSGNLGKVRSNIDLAAAMKEAGLNAAVAIRTRDGEEYIQHAGLYVYLTRRLKGRQMNALAAYQPETAAFIGEIIGVLHKSMKEKDALLEEKDFYGTVCGWAMESQAVKDVFGEEFLAGMKKDFGMLYQTLPRQCIHRDPNPGNIIVQDAENWGFIDFELSEKNIRLYDPCYAATAVLSETFETIQRENWFGVYQNILAGYDRVAHLTKEEKKAAPYVVLGNQMICLAFFSGNEKFAQVYETNRLMTKWLKENMAQLQIK
ncbi:MAG: helix-turn-helix domain-containing protein [Clostridia bacterium]|nr:helix-turn-helix domain-containing protein [Clostridia bacterium]